MTAFLIFIWSVVLIANGYSFWSSHTYYKQKFRELYLVNIGHIEDIDSKIYLTALTEEDTGYSLSFLNEVRLMYMDGQESLKKKAGIK